MDKETYIKYLEILELDSLPQDFPTLAQVKSAYRRLKELYSFSEISVVTEPLEDEFSTNDRMEIIDQMDEAYEALIHFLVDKDREEKQAFAHAGVIEDTHAEYFPPDEETPEEVHEVTSDLTEEDLIPADISHSEISGELDLPEVEDLQADEQELSVTLADESHHHIEIPPDFPEPPEEPEPQEKEPQLLEEPEPPEEPEPFEEPVPAEEPEPQEEPEPLEEPAKPVAPERLEDDLPEPDEMEIEEISQEIEKAKTDPEELFPERHEKEDTTPKDPYVDTVPFPDSDIDGSTIPLPPDLQLGPEFNAQLRDLQRPKPKPESEQKPGTISAGPVDLLEGRAIKGRTLKKVREKLSLGIHEVAVSTKISYKILVNIEKERFAKLPEPGYLRWCISKYAKELTLDHRIVTDEYMKRFRLWQREQESK